MDDYFKVKRKCQVPTTPSKATTVLDKPILTRSQVKGRVRSTPDISVTFYLKDKNITDPGTKDLGASPDLKQQAGLEGKMAKLTVKVIKHSVYD